MYYQDIFLLDYAFITATAQPSLGRQQMSESKLPNELH